MSPSWGETGLIGGDTTYLDTFEVFPISSANRAIHAHQCTCTIEIHRTRDRQWTRKLSTAWNDLCTSLCRVKRGLSVVPRVWWCLNGVCGRVPWFFILPWVTVSGVHLRTEWRTRGRSGLKNLEGGGSERRGGRERWRGTRREREQERKREKSNRDKSLRSYQVWVSEIYMQHCTHMTLLHDVLPTLLGTCTCTFRYKTWTGLWTELWTGFGTLVQPFKEDYQCWIGQQTARGLT